MVSKGRWLYVIYKCFLSYMGINNDGLENGLDRKTTVYFALWRIWRVLERDINIS